jgi:molecular chaperone GrpE
MNTETNTDTDTDTQEAESTTPEPVDAEVTEGEGAVTDPTDAKAADADADADASEPAKAGKVIPLDPETRIQQLENEKVRIAADFANYQKRVNRDRAKWSQEAVRDLVVSLLTVLDNLELSVAAFDGEVKDPAVYRQGVELVQTELMRVLGNHSLERIEASEGTPFDPDLHQAISVQPTPDLEQEEVAMVARSGYRLGDTVLRAAQVVVRKPS